MGIRRVAGALVGVVLLAGCAAVPPASGEPPATAAPRGDPAPFAFTRAPEQPSLMGDAVGRPSLVVLPDGTYLMLRREDMPDGGALLRSADGRDWTPVERADIGLDAAWLGQLVQSEAAIVALGTSEDRSGDGVTDPDTMIWVTVDGRRWTRLVGADAAAVAAFAPGEITGSPSGFAALTYDASATVLLGGPDGRGWHRSLVPAPVASRWTPSAVAGIGDGWVAVGPMRGGSAGWRWRGGAWQRLPLDTAASLSNVEAVGERIIVTGQLEVADVEHPDAEPAQQAVAWESSDGGASWNDTGLDLAGRDGVGIRALAGGFLAIFESADRTSPTTVLWSAAPGAWRPVEFEEGGDGFDRPYVSLAVEHGSRLVLAGNTSGTGAGGDRVVVWTGEIAAR